MRLSLGDALLFGLVFDAVDILDEFEGARDSVFCITRFKGLAASMRQAPSLVSTVYTPA